MNKMIFTQKKNTKEYIFGFLFLLFGIALLFSSNPSILCFLFILAGVVFLGFQKQYQITQSYNNTIRYCLFNIPVYKLQLDFPYPDYVSIFSTNYSQSNEYGAVSAIGHDTKSNDIVVRLFSKNKHLTLLRTNQYTIAYNQANFLKDLLEVPLHNTLDS